MVFFWKRKRVSGWAAGEKKGGRSYCGPKGEEGQKQQALQRLAASSPLRRRGGTAGVAAATGRKTTARARPRPRSNCPGGSPLGQSRPIGPERDPCWAERGPRRGRARGWRSLLPRPSFFPSVSRSLSHLLDDRAQGREGGAAASDGGAREARAALLLRERELHRLSLLLRGVFWSPDCRCCCWSERELVIWGWVLLPLRESKRKGGGRVEKSEHAWERGREKQSEREGREGRERGREGGEKKRGNHRRAPVPASDVPPAPAALVPPPFPASTIHPRAPAPTSTHTHTSNSATRGAPTQRSKKETRVQLGVTQTQNWEKGKIAQGG